MFQDEHASSKDRASRTADVETLERLGRFKHYTTHSKFESPKCLDEHVNLDERVRRTVARTAGQNQTLHVQSLDEYVQFGCVSIKL